MIYKNKALKRNSTFEPEFRESLAGVKRQMGHRELALEQLPERVVRIWTAESRSRRRPTVTGEEHKAVILSVLTECMSDHELEWYRVRHSLSSLIAEWQEMKDFFYT